MKNLINNKGITLLALIITIIVMLILAGVSMSMLFGEEGVVIRANNAAMETEKKAIHENVLGLITYFEEGIKDLDTTYENIDKHYGTDLIDATRGKTSLTVKIKGKHGEYEYEIDGKSTLNNGDAYAILVDDGSGNSTYTMYFIKNEETLEDTKTYYYDEKWNEIIEDTEENKEKIEKAKVKKVEKLYAGIENNRKWNQVVSGKMQCDEIVKNITNVIFKDYIKVKNLMYYFYGFEKCSKIDLKKLDINNTSYDISMVGMFQGCELLTEIKWGENWNNINVGTMQEMFDNCSSLINIDLSKFSISNVNNMAWMFENCSSLVSIDLSTVDTSNVTKMHNMFHGCKLLEKIKIGPNWDTSNVTTMSNMFHGCESLTSVDLSKFNTTSNLTNVALMFLGCSSLTSIDLSNFNTSNVIDMAQMFHNCLSLKTISFGKNWNTSKVTDMRQMFCKCINLIIDCSSWDVTKVTESYRAGFKGGVTTDNIIEPNWVN